MSKRPKLFEWQADSWLAHKSDNNCFISFPCPSYFPQVVPRLAGGPEEAALLHDCPWRRPHIHVPCGQRDLRGSEEGVLGAPLTRFFEIVVGKVETEALGFSPGGATPWGRSWGESPGSATSGPAIQLPDLEHIHGSPRQGGKCRFNTWIWRSKQQLHRDDGWLDLVSKQEGESKRHSVISGMSENSMSAACSQENPDASLDLWYSFHNVQGLKTIDLHCLFF